MTLRLREGYGRATQARNHPGALSTASPPVLRNSFIHDRFARFSPIAGKNCTVLTTLRQRQRGALRVAVDSACSSIFLNRDKSR